MSTLSSRWILGLLAILILAASPAPSPAAGPTQAHQVYLPLLRKLAPAHRAVIASDRDGQVDLYIVRSLGSAVVRLTTTPEQELSPAWSPDGRQISFVRGSGPASAARYSLHTIGADGRGEQELAPTLPGAFRPVWSPDGERIAFEGSAAVDSDGDPLNPDIYVVDRDGANLRRLIRTPEFPERDLAWSPDSSRLAFVSWDGVNPVIAVIGADGSGLRRVSEIFGLGPAWSPDGLWIAFTGAESSGATSYLSIYAQRVAGGERRRLATCERGCHSPTWSPDGSRVAFVEVLPGADQSRVRNALSVVGADGKGRARLLDDILIEDGPTWAPDGQSLAVTVRGERTEVVVLNADGSDAHSLGQGLGVDWAP